MSVNTRYLNPCPSHIAIIGGGRWARVLIEAVSGIVSKNTLISIYSTHNADAMSIWVLEKSFKQDVRVHSDISKLKTCEIDGAIVVNAARDHALIIEKIIQMGVPVLVEKPVTLSYAETFRLARLADTKNVLFAAAHVFLFARYLDNFSYLVANSGKVKSIRVNWTDPKSESRHGEFKQHDQGLPVFYDWLPHILSIITVLTSSASIKDIDTDFYKGGAHVEIKFMLGDVFCHIKLARNDNVRRRVFKVIADQELRLDFSDEPGIIHNAEYSSCGDEKWGVEKRPVARMLSAFLIQAAGGDINKRLDIDIGLRANRLIDGVASLYNQALLSWLKTKLVSPVLVDIDLEYALKEIILFNGYLPSKVDMCIDNIRQVFNSKDSDEWHDRISKSNKPFDVIRLIALSKS
jgi:hypothetical protein